MDNSSYEYVDNNYLRNRTEDLVDILKKQAVRKILFTLGPIGILFLFLLILFISIIAVLIFLGILSENSDDNNSLYGCTNCQTIISGSAIYNNSYTKNQFIKLVNDFTPPNQIGGSGKNTVWGYDTFFKKNASNFFDIATSYGIDPRFIFSIGIHESFYGTSNIAMKKGNFFGYGAYDSSPYDSALTFYDMSDGIKTVCSGLHDYVTEGNWKYNKIVSNGYDPTTIDGVGSLYATDPGWASKVKKIMSNIFGYVENSSSSVGSGSIVSLSGDGYNNIYSSSFGKKYKEFKQNASYASYRNNMYGDNTIAKQGCSITAVAIVLSGYGHNVTPNRWSGNFLVSIDGSINAYEVAKRYDVTTSSAFIKAKTSIKKHLMTGQPAIIHVLGKSSFTNSQHWMALLDISKDGTQVYLSNPNVSGENGWINMDKALYDLRTYILVTGR